MKYQRDARYNAKLSLVHVLFHEYTSAIKTKKNIEQPVTFPTFDRGQAISWNVLKIQER